MTPTNPAAARALLLSGVLCCSLACSVKPPSEQAPAQARRTMNDPKQDELIKKVGLDTLPPGSPQKGVQIAWSNDLASSFLKAGGVAGATLIVDTALPQAPGEASWEWIWSTPKAPSARIQLNVFVSSTGPATARSRLLRLATENMLPDVPYVHGPADLGEVSALFTVPPHFTHLIWAYQNVCLSLEVRDDADVDVLAVARAVDAALDQHVVTPIDPAIPRVDRVDLSAAEVRVNEPLTVRIRMQGADPARKYLVALHDRPADVRLRDASLNLQVTADNPGTKALTILIVDASTLLSTTAQATMVVKR